MKNFEIHQKLGSGSYGVIYKAINKTTRQVCVLKQITLSRLNEKAKKNAINQATIMGKLNHPFIVRYENSFIDERTLNIVMEYCDSGDLAYFLKQQNKKFMKEEKIWRFFLQICMGLEHIHKNKILHRDIKTLNIFLHKNEQVKIGDLGVAKMLAGNDFAQTMVGTPFYLSPQLCEEKPYNQKSDIWALGCLLYELCTFRHPFEAANQASLILKIVRGKYSPIPQFYSKDLKDMIDCCLERDYKRRPTANMILSKPKVKELIEEFKLKEMIEAENKNSIPSVSKQIPKEVREKVPSALGKHIKEPKQKLKSEARVNQPKKNIDKPISVEKEKEEKKLNNKAHVNQEVKNIREVQVKQHLPKKLLFGDKIPETKDQFISILEKQIKEDSKSDRKKELEKPKKNPMYFQIPWKDDKKSKQDVNQKKVSEKIVQDKMIPHGNSKLLIANDPIPKKIEVIEKVKMEKVVSPRVYNSQKNINRSKGIIKSGGFTPNEQPKSVMNEKKKPSAQGRKIPDIPKPPSHKPIYKSEKNIKQQFEKPASVLNRRKDSNGGLGIHCPPRVRKNPKQPSLQPLPTSKSNKVKQNSHSRYSEVTKQEEDLVVNLPDIVKKGQYQSDSDDQNCIDMNRKFKLNQIDDGMVLQKYEQMLESKKQWNNQEPHQGKEQEVEEREKQTHEYMPQEKIQFQKREEEEELIQSNQKVLDREEAEGRDLVEEVQVEESEEQTNYNEAIYEINNFHMEQEEAMNQEQWSFDEEPELPMLQQTETPFFQEANPYLMEQKAQQETLQDKKQYLQIKLKENMKRQDEINKLMQIKIEQCRSMVSKGFDQILHFFRKKINMDKEYTDEDERQVETFLRKRNLTDHNKFQNIYKIMHFEMELENTRNIIQTICKKLSQLQK